MHAPLVGFELHIVPEQLVDRHPYDATSFKRILPTSVTMAYGQRYLERLVEQVRSHVTLDEQGICDALALLVDLSCEQEGKTLIVESGVLPALASILSGSIARSPRAKHLVCDLVISLSTFSFGRLECSSSRDLLDAFCTVMATDNVHDLQEHVGRVLYALSNSYDGCCYTLLSISSCISAYFERMHRVEYFTGAATNLVKNTATAWKSFVGKDILVGMFMKSTAPELPASARRGILDFLFNISLISEIARLEILANPACVAITGEFIRMHIEEISSIRLLTALALHPLGKQQVAKFCVAALRENSKELIRSCAEFPGFVDQFTRVNIENPAFIHSMIGHLCLRPLSVEIGNERLKDHTLHAIHYILSSPTLDEFVTPSFVSARSPKNFALEECKGLVEALTSLEEHPVAAKCLALLH